MIVRSILVLLPLAMWLGIIVVLRPTSRKMTAMLLGFLWTFLSVLIMSILAVRHDLWEMSASGDVFYDVPLGIVFSIAIIVGALIPNIRKLTIVVRGCLQACALLGVIYFSGLINISETGHWFVFMLIAFTGLPALLLLEWTAGDYHIIGRSVLQSIIWTVILLWLFPSILFQLSDDSWEVLGSRDFADNFLRLMPLIIPAGLIASALYQFAVEGDGTAFPYDPPKRLVTGGIYQYLSNPMQVGICLAMFWWGLVSVSMLVVSSSLIALVLFIVFKDVCNGSCAIGEGNPEWQAYQKNVPKWVPRANPWGIGVENGKDTA